KRKADGPICGRWNLSEDELESMPFGITPSVLMGEFYPSPGFFFQREPRKQKADSGEGNGFLRGVFIAERIQDQGGSHKSGLKDGFQVCSMGRMEKKKKESSEGRKGASWENEFHGLS
ncbi:MAG: hypothetical protein EBV34_19685, partial [Betaproteobacteria bacterium]|nr:hypothetical protein [Betaproteobacteria bacterium]